jgi:hypothetical protein
VRECSCRVVLACRTGPGRAAPFGMRAARGDLDGLRSGSNAAPKLCDEAMRRVAPPPQWAPHRRRPPPAPARMPRAGTAGRRAARSGSRAPARRGRQGGEEDETGAIRDGDCFRGSAVSVHTLARTASRGCQEGEGGGEVLAEARRGRRGSSWGVLARNTFWFDLSRWHIS